MNKLKFSAFTMIELIVVMLLTTVIATLSYLAINNTQQQFWFYEKSNDTSLEIGTLNTLLKNDFHQAKDIQLLNEAIVFQMADSRVVYQFETDKIKRIHHAQPNIFNVQILNKKISFENTLIQKGQKSRIDQLELECKYFEDEIILEYSKEYSSKDLWKLD